MGLARRRGFGFTLVELMIVVAIAGIMTGMAVLATSSYMSSYTLTGAAREIMVNVQMAKVTAIRRNTRCVVAFTSGTVGSYVVFLDANADWSQQASEEVILPTKSLPATVSLYQATDNTGAVVTPLMIGFDSHGMAARDASGSFVYGKVFLQGSGNRYMRISVSPSGRILLEKSTDGYTWS